MTRPWQRAISWAIFSLMVGNAFVATATFGQDEQGPLVTERTGISLGLLFTILGVLLVVIAALWDTRLRAIQAMPENKALQLFVSQEQHEKALLVLQEQNTRDHVRIENAIEHVSAQLAERR